MLYLSLNQILAHNPCEDGWKIALAMHQTKGMDTPIPLTAYLESNEVLDVLWSLRCFKNLEGPIRLLAVGIARKVQHLNPDPQVGWALDVAERFARGLATDEEREEAGEEVMVACAAARAAWAVANAVATGRLGACACGVGEVASEVAIAAAKAVAWVVWPVADAAAWAVSRVARAAPLLLEFLNSHEN